MPLSLTDSQLSALFELALPLSPPDRTLFLEEVAAELGKNPTLVLGDGLVRLRGRRRSGRRPRYAH